MAQAINFLIKGGEKLSGEITTNASKNAAVSLLCASLLNKKKTLLKNVPRIEEVNRIIDVLKSIGVSVEWQNRKNLKIIPPREIKIRDLDAESAKKTRSVILFIGSLVHWSREFNIPQAGGCKLGLRTVRPHFFALEKLGINIETLSDRYQIRAKKIKPAKIVLYESGDTITENVLMAAAKTEGETIIKMASANYQVQDLCFFLQKLGVKIEGIGATTLKILGNPEMGADIEYTLSEDPIESMLFVSIAATTNSSLVIKRCPIDFLELELLKLEKMGFKFKILKEYKAENGYTNLADIKTFSSKLKALDEKIYGRPFPGLNIDNLPFFVPVATQARGRTLIHDWTYENRAIYFTELVKLGANIILADPHRVYIEGPKKLKGAEVICPPALRPAAIILIAMLAAEGKSILRNVYSINRGYEDLCGRLQKLGAKIKKIK